MREDLAAGGTGHTLRPVSAHVHVEGTLLREALGTDSTLESAHARMRDHVLEQVVAQRERSPAHSTLVRLLPCGRQGGSRTYVNWKENPFPGHPCRQGLPSPLGPAINPESPCLTGHSGTTLHSQTILSNKDPHTWPGVSPPLSGWGSPLPDPYHHIRIPLTVRVSKLQQVPSQ